MAKDITINPADLPENENRKTEVFQHPQPADWGKPLRDEEKINPALKGKQEERASKAEGLNESESAAQAGAFEGFEDQQEK